MQLRIPKLSRTLRSGAAIVTQGLWEGSYVQNNVLKLEHLICRDKTKTLLKVVPKKNLLSKVT